MLLVSVLIAANVGLFTLWRSRHSENPVVKPGERDSEVRHNPRRLQWDASPDPGVREYRIYVSGESGTYDFSKPTATVPADVTEWSVSGLLAGRYFAVVTAATSSEESAPTGEIEFTVP
jgi:hypothetical protein